jgi:hypothetical protein
MGLLIDESFSEEMFHAVDIIDSLGKNVKTLLKRITDQSDGRLIGDLPIKKIVDAEERFFFFEIEVITPDEVLLTQCEQTRSFLAF